MRRLALSITLFSWIAGCTDDPEVVVAPNPADGQSFEPAPPPPPAPAPATASAPGLSPSPAAKPTLAEARRGFVTKLGPPQPPGQPAPEPPPDVFRRIKYPSPVGELTAYLTPDPGDGQKHPAIVWITGGDSNTIDELWEPAPVENDQTAAAYREAGIVLMFPSLRGGNDNPGRREGFLGEADDVIAAAENLAKQPYVDPERIYLGGHSTGGTLVMLVAELSDRFRAIFAFGPARDVRNYGGQFVYHESSDPQESMLRSPGYWLDSVRDPLFVIEGTGGNIASLQAMQANSTNPLVHFVAVTGPDHFGVLAPANAAIAAKILDDQGPTSTITISEQDLKGAGP